MLDTKHLDELIEKLDVFFNDPDNFDEGGYASDTDVLCDFDPYGALVCHNISVPYSKIVYMREHGYEVTRLDGDSFGWLLGGISKVRSDGKRRLLTFG